MSQVQLSERAKQDIADHFKYIVEKSESGARHLLRAIYVTFENLSFFPYLGVSRDYKRKELQEMRMFPVTSYPDYLIFYKPVMQGIEVMRVLHSSQEIEVIFNNPGAVGRTELGSTD